MNEAIDKNTVAMFVYGTLRKDGWLYSRIRQSLKRDPIPAFVDGYELWSNFDRSYPYMIKGEGRVVGDLMICRNDDNLGKIAKMEIDVGYEVAEVDAKVNVNNKELVVRSVSFILPKGSRRWLGGKIDSGDWNQHLDDYYSALYESQDLAIRNEVVEVIPAINSRQPIDP